MVEEKTNAQLYIIISRSFYVYHLNQTGLWTFLLHAISTFHNGHTTPVKQKSIFPSFSFDCSISRNFCIIRSSNLQIVCAGASLNEENKRCALRRSNIFFYRKSFTCREFNSFQLYHIQWIGLNFVSSIAKFNRKQFHSNIKQRSVRWDTFAGDIVISIEHPCEDPRKLRELDEKCNEKWRSDTNSLVFCNCHLIEK